MRRVLKEAAGKTSMWHRQEVLVRFGVTPVETDDSTCKEALPEEFRRGQDQLTPKLVFKDLGAQ